MQDPIIYLRCVWSALNWLANYLWEIAGPFFHSATFWAAVAAIAAFATAIASLRAIGEMRRTSLLVASLQMSKDHMDELARWSQRYGNAKIFRDLPTEGRIETIRLFYQRFKLTQIAYQLRYDLEVWDLAANPFDAFLVHKSLPLLLKNASSHKLKRNLNEASRRHEAWLADRMSQNLPCDRDFVPLHDNVATHTPKPAPQKKAPRRTPHGRRAGRSPPPRTPT